MTAAVCESVGWEYRRVGEVDPVLAANVRWLAAYRNRRCWDGVRAEALASVFTVPRPLREGVAAVGDRLGVLPVLFHLLWTGALIAELSASVLSETTVVALAGGSR
jgi:hypothetical protein